MKNQLLTNSSLLFVTLLLSTFSANAQNVNPEKAPSLARVDDLAEVKTKAQWLVQNQTSSVSNITNITISEGESGLNLIIENDDNTPLQPLIFPLENNLIIEFTNTELNLSSGDSFVTTDVNEDISRIEAVNNDNGGVTITVTGVEQAPTAQIIPSQENLVLGIDTDGMMAREDEQTIELVVTANRAQEDINEVPRSVTVINREQIEEQTRISRDLGEILPKLVPGIAPSTQTSSIFGQPLRGRNVGVLIDGVPQSTNRNAQRDLRNIDPSSIERIEVLRGPSAIYGDGATGGLINIITRGAGDTPFQATTNVSLNSILTDVGDSFGYNLEQSFGGTSRGWNYFFNASYGATGGFFDSEGDRIPPDPQGQGGLADLQTLNLLGKVGYDINENQNIEFSINYFDDQQNSDFTLDPTPSGEKAEARRGLQLPNQPNTENLVLNLRYQNSALGNSSLSSQIYYRDYSTRFFPFDLRTSPAFGNAVLQSEVRSQKFGTRVDIDTPLLPEDKLNLTWGLDYFNEDSSQPADIFDNDIFANSDGLIFQKIGEGFLSPPTSQNNLGLFAQTRWKPLESLTINGGIRQEFVGVNVGDFTTLGGNQVQGGKLDYSATLFNIGGIYSLNDNVGIYANFAQGFSVADVARALRTSPDGSRVTDLKPEAQKVDTYEIGVRGNWDNVQASLAYFYSFSDLGTTFDSNFGIVRDPQRIYGIEGDINYDIDDNWAVGGTFTWTDGSRDPNNDGNFDADLPNTIIAPVKLTAYVENQTTPNWRNRLQLLYSGGRDPQGTGFDLGPVDSYLTADFISSVKLGDGELNIGIENLFNSFYYPNISQIYGGRSRSAAKGISFKIGYSFDW
ncbi:TonB-dependent receptor [Cyanobacterium stanieri LEGE 03274]|uniref:TonB-dependent receptor n=1 Tax=Cyanobacterium stanieri LEGE 03274 TaxID=1828756 RepID=A0ABR9V3V1_9CHRO|nr:TonB-dependent receptor [Cyanobacterium stanieri]MBE9222567.1 TonB-dependent receptor [Cyanobacterium stanieri LEGE 03274]